MFLECYLSDLHSKAVNLKEAPYLYFVFYLSTLFLLLQIWADNIQVLLQRKSRPVSSWIFSLLEIHEELS